MVFLLVSIILVCILGFVTAIYALKKSDAKRPDDPEHDPLDQIRHSMFLGFAIEKLFMAYYALVGITHLMLLITNSGFPEVDLAVLALTGVIVYLLLYEIAMRFFAFKEICKLCLVKIVYCSLIFYLIVSGFNVRMIPLLQETYQVTLTFHVLGVIFGVGGTAVIDIMFFHFLRDFKLHIREAGIMHLISQLIIAGLGLIIVTGVALYYGDEETFRNSPRFLTKMITVAVAIINGILLNLYVTPKLKKISFRNEDRNKKYELLKIIAFALGGISVVSWFSAYFLAMLKDLSQYSFTTLTTGYFIILFTAIAGSQIMKKIFEKRGQSKSSDYQDSKDWK
ncbi:MAG: hypothetical protein ACK40G_05520 [Cytophagaceae bacterium]